MAKTATIGVRVDEELKSQANQVFDDMGLPMSLGIEMFLRQVVENKKLPFTVEAQGAKDVEREKREREFWHSFLDWYFDVWPSFDSPDILQKATEELGFSYQHAGKTAERFISEACENCPPEGTSQAWEARADLGRMRSLLGDAKELIYWALDMEKTFVPSLSFRYQDQADKWRYKHLKAQAKKNDNQIASGVVATRYFGKRD
ncbi:MAG: type II toxin-antitoxin system RelB/DinJ family antitoxin [Coriobacteriia bacterium]|nr:type II toxin-antitoxin system RelB/DinJ family antitoxin [Coriobacteriia bacterium]